MFTLLLYRFGPNEMRLRFRDILPGALLSTAAWYGTNLLIGLYANVFHNLSSVYGTLGAVFVYLTFLYFSGLMFLVGAELNAELVHRRRHRTAGDPSAALRPSDAQDEATRLNGAAAVAAREGSPAPRAVPHDAPTEVATREIEWP